MISFQLPSQDGANVFEFSCVSRQQSELLQCVALYSSLIAAEGRFATRNVSTQRQKFHTDDINQRFHNKSGSHGVPNANLFNFTFLLVDFGKVLCLSANELQQKSNATAREYYIPQTLTVLLKIHHVYI